MFWHVPHLFDIAFHIIVGDLPDHDHLCVISKPDFGAGAVPSHTVMCVQGVQRGAKYTTLGGNCVEDRSYQYVLTLVDKLLASYTVLRFIC